MRKMLIDCFYNTTIELITIIFFILYVIYIFIEMVLLTIKFLMRIKF